MIGEGDWGGGKLRYGYGHEARNTQFEKEALQFAACSEAAVGMPSKQNGKDGALT
jgi:hypothetical protein